MEVLGKDFLDVLPLSSPGWSAPSLVSGSYGASWALGEWGTWGVSSVSSQWIEMRLGGVVWLWRSFPGLGRLRGDRVESVPAMG